MYPTLAIAPVWSVVMLLGGAVGAAFSGKEFKSNLLGAAVGALVCGVIAYFLLPGDKFSIPIQSYGLFVLIGFVTAIVLAEYRAAQLGIARFHVVDMALTGCFLGLIAARAFYVWMNWKEFTPFTPSGFDSSMIIKMVKLWEGGLVFYGAFVVTIPWTYYYCVKNKIPAIPFLDICGPGLIIGQAFGRIGCFFTGCCFGRVCDANFWAAVTFPKYSPAYLEQLKIGMLTSASARSMPMHPAQIYASISAFLCYAFLFLYWPRRKFDGEVLSLMMIMAGATRFFEEILRADDAPPFPQISTFLTIAQWVAMGIIVVGFAMLFYFKKRNILYQPSNKK